MNGIRSLINFGRSRNPLGHSVLYPRHSKLRLALKLFRGEPAISGFVWNFSANHKSSPTISTGVCSVLHRALPLLQPEVITDYFNRRVFGPPQSFTSASTCSWLGHPVSGLRHDTFLALFKLAFASAPRLYRLTSHHIVTRRPVLQKVRHHARMALCLLVSIRFQVLFHSPPGVLFTFPSRYCSLSVTWSYLAL